MHHNQRHEHGFTMVEMMVVVVIIGILAAIAIPLYLEQRNAAQEAALKSDLHNVGTKVASAYDWRIGGFKTPVDRSKVPAESIDPSWQIPVELSRGVILGSANIEDGFCIVGVHDAKPNNLWFFSPLEGGLVPDSTFCADVSPGDAPAGPSVTPTPVPSTPVPSPSPTTTTPAPAPTTEPSTTPTTTPTTEPVASPSPTPTTEPTTAAPSPSPTPTTAPTTAAPSPTPSPTPTGPYTSSYKVTYTTRGLFLEATVLNASGKSAVVRTSASPITGQNGYVLSQPVPANGYVDLPVTDFKGDGTRYWQLEIGGDRANPVAKGSVSPTNTVNTGP